MFLLQHNHILFVLKHHHTNLALCIRGEKSHSESSSLCLVFSSYVESLSEHVNKFFIWFFFFFCYRCKHENLVELLGFSSDGAQPCLVYEYMPNGSLLDRLACLVSEIL